MIHNSQTMMDTTEITYKPSIFTLVILISFATVCAILCGPALPQISDFFSVTNSGAQWTMTLFLLGYALGQLPYGVLANRYGRIPALKIGIALQLIGCLFCIASYFSGVFPILLLGRFIMALGAGVGLMMAYTLMNDFYNKEEARKLSAKLVLAFAILPGISMTVGGVIANYFAWQYCFYFLIIYGLFVYCVTHKIAEPVFQKTTNINMQTIVRDFTKILKLPTVVLYALMMGGGAAIIYAYSAIGPFLGIEQLHLSESKFGLISMVPPLGIVLGSFITQLLNKHYAPLKVIQIGIVSTFIGGLWMLINFNTQISVVGLFGSMLFVYMTLSLVLSNASALASRGATDKANASSIMNFLNMCMGAIGVGLAQCLPSSWLLALPVIVLGVLFCMLGLAFYLNQSCTT